MKRLVVFLFLCPGILVGKLNAQPEQPEDFNFIFMTDIHLEYGRNAPAGFQMAIDTANKLDADFVLTGGDQIADALEARHSRADSLNVLYGEMIRGLQMPVYNTIGNHDLYGLYRKSGADTSDSDYDRGMYERFFGESYYSFDHKGWHFIVLNSMIDAHDKYIGYIDEEQLQWLKADLAKTDKSTPIIVSSHIPLITTYGQLRNGALAPNDPGLVVTNSRDVLLMMYEHNLKLVLQGHLHIVEYIYLQNKIRFLTGGAVSAKWWGGPLNGMEEGFMYIRLKDGDIDWEYIDYGYEAKTD